MNLEDYFEFLSPTAIRLKGHRIGIEHVIERYRDGDSPEAIAQEFPGVSLEAIYATITYYLHYQREVEAYLAGVAALVERRMHAADVEESPVVRRLQALQTQRAAEQRAG